MAKSIQIANATYSDVPKIQVPLADGSGVATFIEESESGGGGSTGLAGWDVIYTNDSESITYTSTTASTAKTISGLTTLKNYPVVLVIIENADITKSASKFIRSVTVIGNSAYPTGATITRYGTQHYYSSNLVLTNLASTSYGLWGYSLTTGGSLTIRGRVNTSYYSTLTGTYKVRVYGLKAGLT